MLAPITSLSSFGAPCGAPALGITPVVGPVVTLAFTLPIAGPVPNVIQAPVPQSCQNSMPNVQLEVEVVDQDGNAVDISSAIGLQLWLLAPDGSPRPVPAAFVSNGMDGLLEYTTSAEDLTEAGLWGLQAQLTFGAQILTTRWAYFAVEPNVVDI